MRSRTIRARGERRRLFAVFSCAFAALLLIGISTSSHANNGWWDGIKKRFGSSATPSSKYRLHNSDQVVIHNGRHAPGFYWVDNEELLFTGMHITADPTKKFGERTTYSLGKWNIRTGSITRLRDFGSARPSLCLHDSYARISLQHPDSRWEVFHGPLGAEKPDSPMRSFNHHICRPADTVPELPSWTKGRDVYMLQSLEGGFIDFGETSRFLEFNPLKLYRPGAKQQDGIELPWHRRRVVPDFRYYAFRDGYFVESDWSHHPRPAGAPYPVYWLFRDGSVEQIAEIPWGPWRSRGDFSVVPTKVGLVFVSSNAAGEHDLDHAGLYLMKGGRVERVIRGWISNHGPAVSPDGCKVAFTYAPRISQKINVLKALDLCAGEAP